MLEFRRDVAAAPEPVSVQMLSGGFIVSAIAKSAYLLKRVLQAVVPLAALTTICFGSVSVTLTPSVASGAMVGTPVTWTARATDSANAGATFSYQFLTSNGGGAWQVRKDWYNSNTFPWTPTFSEGPVTIQVNVRSSTGATGFAQAPFNVTSRITGSTPVVSSTNHPLVALYSMPPCPSGQTARVRYKMLSEGIWKATLAKNCLGNKSLNFYIAGMRANSNYQMQQDVFNGPFSTQGPIVWFTTGAVPSGAVAPPYSISKPMTGPNSTSFPVLLTAAIGGTPYAIDAQGQVIWYLPKQAQTFGTFTRILPGGDLYTYTSDYAGRATSLFREYDLAGNIVRETNYAAISQRIVARGGDPIFSVHHEAIQLPNGWIALFGHTEKVADQGKGPVDVLGDQVVVIDTNFNVKWVWNEFDHLDISRPAILGETCVPNGPGCPPTLQGGYKVGDDWTHSNSIFPSPDGNLIISIRHQDWIVKIRYANGTGDGAILWRFGKDGDFTTSASDPFPWPSHQHDAEYTPSGLMTLFDNGNTRVQTYGGHSRGQEWQLDEVHHVATRVVNADLGAFSLATGSTKLLPGGYFLFNLGFVGTSTQIKEMNALGETQSQVNYASPSYRSFRLRSMYTGE